MVRPDPKSWPAYVMLVAESSSFTEREKTRILLSKRRGSIFIQTDQPVYKPNQKGKSKSYF